MCDLLLFQEREISLREVFLPNKKILYRENFSRRAEEISSPVYWDGWVREETIKEWISAGIWRRAEIKAKGFSLISKGIRRDYELPKHHVVKGLLAEIGERFILKVLTREAVGKEKEVSKRFTLTGKETIL